MDTIATDANELFLFGSWLKQRRENSDTFKIVGNVYYKNQHRLPTQLNGRHYWETRSRHLIQDRYYSPIENRLQPETHPRIITWYGFQGLVYKKTKAGEITIEATLERWDPQYWGNPRIPRYYLIVKQDEVNEETETEDEEETKASSEEEEVGDREDTKKGDKGNDNGNGTLRRSPRLANGATVRYF